MSRSIFRIALGDPPSLLDQMAATVNIALDDGRFDVAVEIFRKLGALDRIAVGMKAIALGADPKRVADAAEAATTDLPQEPIEIEMEPDFAAREYWASHSISRRVWPSVLSTAGIPRPTNAMMFVLGAGLLALAAWLWRRK